MKTGDFLISCFETLQITTEGVEKRRTRERFLLVLGDPADQNTPNPMSGSQTLSFPALQNEEWRDRGGGGQR